MSFMEYLPSTSLQIRYTGHQTEYTIHDDKHLEGLGKKQFLMLDNIYSLCYTLLKYGREFISYHPGEGPLCPTKCGLTAHIHQAVLATLSKCAILLLRRLLIRLLLQT